ncbi:hypothetical protein [Prosthecochloris sp. HL-130-GSB]|mgnify:CR=1 FL=1|jgi:ABC-type nickel/cobalt efflux system permease component RcnA|uniref:Uncharacterized protein n=1 Tax=Prosthecochloris aestuarii TaxID=1102 RepID=A0A831SRU0_PROAE|nr:hypothetical protein [Prosthecochloris sp. HL-130-GSB]ARM30449.1 hypothetical protein B9H02_02770 [Prosthecochloris sp. HL-130-GSB]MBO8093331.1 hypothetical protein [Prosthecochloris sp.]HED31726.1 hypothetical protein [Prosthecochloris aestuarii]
MRNNAPDTRSRARITVGTAVSLASSAVFIFLGLYIAVFLSQRGGAHAGDIYPIALLVGSYGMIRLWRTIRAMNNDHEHSDTEEK